MVPHFVLVLNIKVYLNLGCHYFVREGPKDSMTLRYSSSCHYFNWCCSCLFINYFYLYRTCKSSLTNSCQLVIEKTHNDLLNKEHPIYLSESPPALATSHLWQARWNGKAPQLIQYRIYFCTFSTVGKFKLSRCAVGIGFVFESSGIFFLNYTQLNC